METAAVYFNTEFYVQDNWKLTSRLTLDYGMRFVHQHAQYDKLEQASNFLPETWNIGAAPVLYRAGCANGVSPCTGTNRQAQNPLTGQFLGTNSSLAIGTLVPGTGNITNGLLVAGTGNVGTKTYGAPALVYAPRLGAAYDLTGTQSLVLRGGGGLFYDRPSSTAFSQGVTNPPTSRTVTVRYGSLQSLGSGGLTTEVPPSLSAFAYDGKVPTSAQWNGGIQMALPGGVALDVEYVGQHSYNTWNGVNINNIDIGWTLLPQYQDLTLAPTTPGATAVSTDLMRTIRGYSSINQQQNRGWRTYHSLQWSFNRRFRNGLSFGVNDTMGFSDTQQSAARLQHAADGTYTYRADQAEADKLLGNNDPRAHLIKANFVWDLPDLQSSRPALRVLSALVNDWQLSGIWTGSTGAAYTVGFGYQSGGTSANLTGSPDYAARIRIVGDPGQGCSDDPYRQFNTAAFQGPLVNSVGLESGSGYLRGCFSSVLDLSVARTVRLGGGRSMQLRVDAFNAPNEGRITNRSHDDQPEHTGRPGHGVKPAVRRSREPALESRTTERGRLRRRKRLSGAADRARTGAILILRHATPGTSAPSREARGGIRMGNS